MKIPLHNLLPDGSQTSSAPRRRTPPREARPFTAPIERHPPGPLFRMPSLQLRVRGLFAATVLSLLSLLTTAKAEILFSDDFSAPDGPLIEYAGTPWRTMFGTPAQIRIAGGALQLEEATSESVEVPFGGPPITDRPVYAGFTATVSALPTGEAYHSFAAFSIVNGPRPLSRVVITTQEAEPGKFRIGVTHGLTGSGGQPAPLGIIPVDLTLNTPFRLVLRQDLPNGLGTVWVNPTSEQEGADNSSEGTFGPRYVVGFVFSQRLRSGEGTGTMKVDDLVVATTFDEVRTAPLPPPPGEPRILGRWPMSPRATAGSFTAQDGYLYGSGDLYGSGGYLRIFDIRDLANRREIMTPKIYAHQVAVAGGRAYAVGGTLRILDVSNPSVPRMLSSLPWTEAFGNEVAVAEQHVFILDSGWSVPEAQTDPKPGLHVVDATDPVHPIKVSFLSTTNSYRGLIVSGGYAYTQLADGTGSAIFDVRDPMKPAFVRNFPGKILAVSGQRAYVVPVAGRLQVVDISNPTNPVVLGTEAKPTGTGLYDALRLEGDLAYVVGGASLFLYDVSNPAAPRRISELKRDTEYSSDFAVWNKRAFFGGRNVHVVDAADPARPRPEFDPSDLAARVRNPFEEVYGSANDTAVDGRYAYVADPYTGLHVIDVSDSARPRRVASVGTNAASVTVANGYAYVRKGIPWQPSAHGLEIYNMAEPLTPRRVASVALSSRFSIPDYQGVHVARSNCFVGTVEGLLVFDVSNPAQPRRIATVNSIIGALRMIASGNHLFVATHSQGLRILDISNPSRPREVGRQELNVNARDVVLTGDQAFWGGPRGVHVENVSNPSRPVQVGSIFGFMPTLLATSRSHLFVADYDAALNVSLKVYAPNPSGLPTEVASTSKRFSDISRLLWANGKLFATAGFGSDGGLLIFSDPFAPAPPNLSGIRRDPSGGVRLTLTGAAGSPFTVERSPDLLRWETWSEGTLQETDAAGRELLDDTASTTPYSFYRIRKP
jgi:hypothetical protein